MQGKIIGNEAVESACEKEEKKLLVLMAGGNSAGGMATHYMLEGLGFKP